jgi:hypothetical protein
MNDQKMMGFVTPGDQKVPVTVRDWDAQRRALWRSKCSWEIVQKEVTTMLARTAHMEGCAGKTDETVPCLADCPDRELRMSALVILNAARQFAPMDARSAVKGPYYAPSREYFSEVLAELGACQVEIQGLDPDGSKRLVLRASASTESTSTDSKPMDTIAAPQLEEVTP